MSIAIGNIQNIHEDGSIWILHPEEIHFAEGRTLDDCDYKYHKSLELYEFKNFYSLDFNRG